MSARKLEVVYGTWLVIETTVGALIAHGSVLLIPEGADVERALRPYLVGKYVRHTSQVGWSVRVNKGAWDGVYASYRQALESVDASDRL